MKKVLFTLAAAVMMFAATSCKKENVNEPENFNREPEAYEFLATVGGGAQQNAPKVGDGMNTMATFNPENKLQVLWQVDDVITVNGVAFTCTTNPGIGDNYENRAYFENENYKTSGFHADVYHAFYSTSVEPSTTADHYAEGTLKENLVYNPDNQAELLPMYAYSTDHWLNFNNICAAIKIYVPYAATKIVISNTSAAMNGDFTLIDNKAVISTAPTIDENHKKITITKKDNGTFTPSEPVFFALPANSVDGYADFCITFYNGDNEVYSTGASKSPLKVEANKIYSITRYKDYLPGEFSVSDTKKVQFTTGNLCYDVVGGRTYLAPTQIYYNTNVTGNERCYFAWNSTITGAIALPYEVTNGDIFAKSMTLTGKNEELTILSKGEWEYLLGLGTGSKRINASNLCKLYVNAGNVLCLVIAPDGFTGKLEDSYSMADVKSSGLVFLPYAGHVCADDKTTQGTYSHVNESDGSSAMGRYWTSTPSSKNANKAYNLMFNREKSPSLDVIKTDSVTKSLGRSIRLVKEVTTSSN